MTGQQVIPIITIITALLSFLTASIAYRREKLKNTIEGSPPPNLKILKFRQQLPKRQLATALKVLLVTTFPLALGFLALSIWQLYVTRSLFTIISVAFWGLGLLSYAFQIRGLMRGIDEPSRVRREMRVIIDGDYDAVFNRCENALRAIGASIIASDRSIGLICARTGIGWKSFGEQVEIKVFKSGQEDCTVTLVSDSILSVTLVDYGKNSQNIDALIKYL